MGKYLFRNGACACESFFPHNDSHFFRVFCKKNCFFRCRKAPADDKYVFSAEEFSVAGGTVCHSPAAELHLALESDLSRACSRGYNNTRRPKSSLVRDNGFYVFAQLDRLYLGKFKLRPEVFRLLPHIFCQMVSVCPKDSRIIDYL